MQIGTLTLEMAANVARLQQDMQQARKAVDDATGGMRKAADMASKALGAIGVGVSVAGLASFVKGAINAADEMSKLGQKAGLAAQEIAGLQLAFDQAGAGDKFAPAMAKLSKEISAGNDQLETMGVRTKNLDGTFRSSREVLGDVAGKFATYRDGVEKTAAAQAIFGKAGADMIPLLNGGAESLDEYDKKARELGLTLSDETQKAAERFNDQLDLIRKQSNGLANELATQLLPTLNDIAAAMLAAQGPTASLGSMLGKGLIAVVQTVAVLLYGIVTALRLIAGEIETIGRQLYALASLDFSKFDKLGKDWTERAKQLRAAADAFDKAAMGQDLSNTGRGQGYKDERALGAVRSIREQTEAWKAAAPVAAEADKAARAATEARAKFVANLQKEAAMLGLTAVESKVYEATLIGITGKQLEEVRALAMKTEAQKAFDAVQKESITAYANSVEAQQKANVSLQEQITKQQEYNASLGLTKEAVTALEVAKLQEQAVSKDRLATLADEIDWTGELGKAYRAQAAALRELAKLKGEGAAKETIVEEAKKATEEWKKFTDQVNQSLTDSLMRAFESGGKFFKTFWRSIVNTLKTSVLKMMIQPVVGGVTGFFGLNGAANAATSAAQGGNVLSGLSNVYSAGKATLAVGSQYAAGTMSSANAAGTIFANSTGTGIDGLLATNGAYGTAGSTAASLGSAATLMGASLVGFMAGKMISGGYSAIGKSGNTSVAIGTAIGAFVGGPIGAIIGGAIGGLVNRTFGRKAAVSTAEGITGTFSTSGADVKGFADMYAKGGFLRSSKRYTQYSAIDSGMQGALDESLMAITAATKAYASILGLNAEAINGITQSVRINLKGLDAKGREKAITDALGGFGNRLAEELLGTFTTVYDPIRGRKNRIVGYSARQVFNPGEFMREGESASAALSRLASSLVAVNSVFDTLNVTLMRGSLIGADASNKLLDVFGGAEKFAEATSAYYGVFYSETERTATATRQLTEALATMGMALPANRDGFRALVDAQNLYTDAGRQTYAALIGLAPVFDQIITSTDAAAASLKEASDAAAAALKQIGDTLMDEVRRLRGLLTTDSPNSLAVLQSQFAIGTAAARAGDRGALERLPSISQALESAAALQAVTAADLAVMRGQIAASLEGTMSALGVRLPAFDVGTNYVPQNMIAQIHEGEAIIPKAFNPAAGGFGSARLEAQIERLTLELEGLRGEVRAGVGHSAKTARILERVTPNGTAINTVTEA